MDIVKNIISETPTNFWIILLVLITLFIVFAFEKNGTKIRFWWLSTKYKLWHINNLAKETGAQITYGEYIGWYGNEKILCNDFFKFCPAGESISNYEKSKSYLAKADEIGRKLFPWYGWLAVLIILIVESLGFGQLLTSYIAETLSQKYQRLIGYGLSAMVVIILLAATHKTGEQCYRNNQLRKVRHWFESSGNEKKKALAPYPGVTLDNNHVDDDEPMYIQLASRIPDDNGKFLPSYGVTIATVLLIATVGVGTFYMRENVHESLQGKQTRQSNSSIESLQDNASDIDVLLGKQTQIADEDAKQQIKNAENAVATSAFILLTIVFFAAQALGVGVGYFYGVCGKESKKAIKNLKGFSSRDDFIMFHRAINEYVSHHAQSLLESLQLKARKYTTDGNYDANIGERTFFNFEKIKLNQSIEREISANKSPHLIKNTKESINSTNESLEEMEDRIRKAVENQVRQEKEEKIRAKLLKAERLRHGLNDD